MGVLVANRLPTNKPQWASGPKNEGARANIFRPRTYDEQKSIPPFIAIHTLFWTRYLILSLFTIADS